MSEVLDLSVEEIDEVKIDTKYCVEQGVHDLHVRKALAAGYPPIPAVKQDHCNAEPIALVCSGPSLKATWEEVRGFKVILTCSGAHDFMIERGIVPTYHMETDPRAHKAVFTKQPKQGVTYLIASNCHPDVFANLTGHDVRLWHVLSREDLTAYPRGHWLLTGGCNVGLRAMVMARLLGYRDIHIFGMDCSSDGAAFHASAHPNEPKEKSHRRVKVKEREFQTSGVFLECARQFFKETQLMHDSKFTLHGDGLLQALATQKFSDPKQLAKRDEEIKKRGKVVIAVALPETITSDYAKLNRELHERNWDYGGHGYRYAPVVKKLVEAMKPKSVLDYGCGKGGLGRALDFPIWEYDPAIPGKELPPRAADLVVCTDVLEHIEPERLADVLADIRRCTKRVAYIVIHTGPSGKSLADGRNAHLIQQGAEWWQRELEKFFTVPPGGILNRAPMLHCTLGPR